MPRRSSPLHLAALAALLLAAALCSPQASALCATRGEVTAEAEEAIGAKDWERARDLLAPHVARRATDARAQQLLGRALLELEENDRAAYHLARAAELLEAGGDSTGAKRARRDLAKADPLNGRRERILRDTTSRLYKAASKLFSDGHAERALALLEALEPAATGKDAGKVTRLHAEVRAAFEEVDLDGAGREQADGEELPLVSLESEHYVLVANLEQELVQLVADTMDDVYGYYVQLYFDGDAAAASGEKAEIRIHPTRESMLAGWSGGSAPEGWWSPGENRVTCYDTRTTTGSLDWMQETLFHEASHQFMTLLNRRGGWAPAWLNEGTSSFFEGATAMADHRVLWPDAALGRLSNLAAALRSRSDEVTLEKVIGYAGGGSYPGSYYAWGWGLVYFMQQYEDPDTLEYVYRPLYARYREEITTRGGDSRELFDEVFLSGDAPLGHADLAAFERDWRSWILEGVQPLHSSPKPARRELRMQHAQRYLAAAEAARTAKKPAVPAEELLRRALGHLEYVRGKLDGDEHPDVELLALQARTLEELGRPESAAPLLALQLELADEGTWSPSEEVYAALEEKLRELDRKNYALRRAESTVRGLARTARKLLEDYREQDPPMPLAAYTFAAELGRALDDEEVLLPMARELRAEARAAGLLAGEVQTLVAPRKSWMTIYNAEAKSFEQAPEFLSLESVRPNGYINTELSLTEEYELRARFRRDGEQYRSTCHGLVVAGVKEGDWLVFGLLKEGKAGLWRLKLSVGGGVVTKKIETFYLDPAPGDDEDLDVAVHVTDGRAMTIRVGGCEVLESALPEDLPKGRFAGLYVKDGTVKLESPVVELYP
jgi:hypothetical protein